MMDAGTLEYLKGLAPQLEGQGRWVFVPNARTASTSITGDVLADRVVLLHRTPNHWDRAWAKVCSNANAIFFTVVRNSWQRVLSAWQLLRTKDRTDMDFMAFLKAVELANPRYEHFFRPQAVTFLHGGVPIKEMNVLRFENLAEDWASLAKRIDAPSQLPRRNHFDHKHYTEYYDPACVRIVGRVYATEIDELGYEFG
jgi:hypothetical protein